MGRERNRESVCLCVFVRETKWGRFSENEIEKGRERQAERMAIGEKHKAEKMELWI